MIEGDNLEVLKLLQKSYAGKVKMIYIDPPYNTGKDFVYPDNFTDNIKNYLELTGQTDGEGRKLSSNTEASGRFHTDWLNMMYPRLKLARNLLREDGVIFISLDDGEITNLRRICDDIFGEENFVGCLIWQKKVSPSNDSQFFSNDHEYIVVYAKVKNPGVVNRLARTDDHNQYYTNPDSDPRGLWNSTAATCNKNYIERPNLFYPIPHPKTGEEVWPKKEAVWAIAKEKMFDLMANKSLYWGADNLSKSPRIKIFLSEAKNVVPRSVLSYKDVGHTQSATAEYRELLPNIEFDYPKPSSLIQRLISLATSEDDNDFLIVDFFAGSGTTGHATYGANKIDGGNRRFILTQLPEPIDTKSQAFGLGFKNISDITKERLRRAATKIGAACARNDSSTAQLSLENEPKTPQNPLDLGFKVFKLDTSNIRAWNPNPDELADTLMAHTEHLAAGRSEADVLYEVLLKQGLDLAIPIQRRGIAGHTVHSVGAGALLVCLAREGDEKGAMAESSVTAANAEALALGMANWHTQLAAALSQTPAALQTRVVLRDSVFDGDVAKTNLTAILRQRGLEDVRSL